MTVNIKTRKNKVPLKTEALFKNSILRLSNKT